MKEILVLMARYNQTVNNQLFDLLDKCDSEIITGNEGSYFNNILGLLNHILVSDLGWLTAYRDSSLDLPSLNSSVLDFEHPGWRKNLYNDLVKLRSHRDKVDSLFIDFVDETPGDFLEGNVEVTRSNGKKHNFPFGKVLMHLFNHQTHHRGAISQILDKNGVDNDYSNLMRLLM
jgi:uncharacterized damage-inducible protein DinB